MSHVTAPNNKGTDGNLIASQLFAQVYQAFLECSDKVQKAIQDMVQIVNAPDATADEREAALETMAEALFPSKDNGTLGIDLEDCDRSEPEDDLTILRQLEQEEATFAERLSALLESRNMTQSELANAIGVGQPAISMMLSRNCRPQKRTVEKIAQVLKVNPEDIWPGTA
jgi:predicted XRE-type DNA-binding protein